MIWRDKSAFERPPEMAKLTPWKMLASNQNGSLSVSFRGMASWDFFEGLFMLNTLLKLWNCQYLKHEVAKKSTNDQKQIISCNFASLICLVSSLQIWSHFHQNPRTSENGQNEPQKCELEIKTAIFVSLHARRIQTFLWIPSWQTRRFPIFKRFGGVGGCIKQSTKHFYSNERGCKIWLVFACAKMGFKIADLPFYSFTARP